MKRFALLIAVALVLSVFSLGCTLIAPVVPPPGLVFNQTKAPISTDFDKTPVGTRQGTASATSMLWGLLAFGDCSIATAARNGNLTKIYHADYEFFNIIGIYTKTTVIVTGE